MSDTSSRTPTGASQRIADALLRSVGGMSAQLRVTATNTDGAQCEVGLIATTFAAVILSPVVMRKLRPMWQSTDAPRWELLVSASSVENQVRALSLSSAQALFAMTLSVTVAAQDYVIESVAGNEAFGEVYLYRLQLRESRPQTV
jgi:hypothetical protein